MRSRVVLAVLALALLITWLPGCGNGDLAPVKGLVTCGGKPVGQATVIFAPKMREDGNKEPGRSGIGLTDEQGIYEISTHKLLDGAMLGKHRVRVSLDDTNPARCKRVKEFEVEVKPGQNTFDIELDK